MLAAISFEYALLFVQVPHDEFRFAGNFSHCLQAAEALSRKQAFRRARSGSSPYRGDRLTAHARPAEDE
jgi:hypothetical protein